MIRNLFKKSPLKAWVIKQIDADMLHLCGQGVLESNDKPRHVKKALEAGSYQGGVRMGDTGIVLNTRLLAALVPLDRLKLLADGQEAEWQGRLGSFLRFRSAAGATTVAWLLRRIR